MLEPQAGHLPSPVPSPGTQPFWDGCDAGELRYQRCPTCDFATQPPALACPRCGPGAFTWEVSAGLGTVYSWTTIWRPAHPSFPVPYVAVIVAYDEGFSLISNLVGCEPEAAAVGLRVAVEFHPTADGHALPYVRPA